MHESRCLPSPEAFGCPLCRNPIGMALPLTVLSNSFPIRGCARALSLRCTSESRPAIVGHPNLVVEQINQCRMKYPCQQCDRYRASNNHNCQGPAQFARRSVSKARRAVAGAIDQSGHHQGTKTPISAHHDRIDDRMAGRPELVDEKFNRMRSMIAMAKMEMKPTAADTLNGVPVTTRANTSPRQASGTCAINISVLTNESVAAYKTAIISSKATAVMLTPVLSSYLLRTGSAKRTM